MSDKEREAILAQVKNLPEDQKQFILGYAAGGVSAKAESESKDEE